jgi:ribose transport system substrate-binding protein
MFPTTSEEAMAVFRLLVLFIFLAGFLGCSNEEQKSSPPKQDGLSKGGEGKIKVGFVSNNAAEFWTIAEAGTAKAAREFDVDVAFLRPPNGTAAEQKSMIEDLLTQDVKAIAISVNDPKNQHNFLNQIAAKVPLITQDNDAPHSKRLCYLGTNNYEAGKAVGKLVKEAMPEGGKIAIFVGRPDALNAQERRQGVLDELAGQKDAPGPEKFGKYTLHHPPAYYDYVDLNKCKEQAADALTQLQDEDNVCLIGLWQYNPPAIYQAVKQAGKLGKVKIVGFDEHDTTLLAIKDGHIFGTVVQNPFEFGYQSVRIMTALAKNDRSVLPRDGILHIPHRVFTRETVEPFQKELRKLLGKGST